MRRLLNVLLIATISSIVLLGCSSGVTNDGRVVSDGGTPAKDDRLFYYDLMAEEGHSAVWADQNICIMTIDHVIYEAETLLNDFYSSTTGISYGIEYDATTHQENLEQAEELGDTKFKDALEKVPSLGKDLAYGNIDLAEAHESIIEACNPNKISQDDLHSNYVSAASLGEDLSELRTSVFLAGPNFHIESGTYDFHIESSTYDGVRPHDFHSENDSAEMEDYDDTCDTLLADLIIEYAHDEITVEEVLEPFPATQHDFLQEHLKFVREEIDSRNVPPEHAGTLMGRVSIGNDCDIN